MRQLIGILLIGITLGCQSAPSRGTSAARSTPEVPIPRPVDETAVGGKVILAPLPEAARPVRASEPLIARETPATVMEPKPSSAALTSLDPHEIRAALVEKPAEDVDTVVQAGDASTEDEWWTEEPVEQAAFQDTTDGIADSLEPVPGDDAPMTGEDSAVQLPPGPEYGLEPDPNAYGGDDVFPDPVHLGQNSALHLNDIIAAVYNSYPLLNAALQDRRITEGELMAAAGEYDLKLKGASENGPLGFYRTYRQSVGLVQPLYGGGEAFAGYRIGRGSFQPWYLERQTNDGGEFKAGVAVPLSRDRHIDPRRAELWRSSYERQLVEPEIQAQLIDFIQEASYAYWDWVAAGEQFLIADRILRLAEERTSRIQAQVEANLVDPPVLTDNRRLVADRRGKWTATARKLQQSAVKLSLFYRGIDGHPLIPDPAALPGFPDPEPISPEDLAVDTQVAIQQRPEIAVYSFLQRQLEVDYAEASNEFRPSVDAIVSGSKDMGEPTSSKNDKGPFELDAGLYVDVPLQRRKARGKMQAVEGKISQLNAKRRMTEDKIVADVQTAYAALSAAYEQVQLAEQAVVLAEDLARRERLNFEEGLSDLLTVALREQYAAESAQYVVEALLLYYQARADYRAALAEDRLQ